MENRFVATRRAAVWKILRSRASDEDKVNAMAEMAEREGRQAYGRGLRATRGVMATPRSAIKAGKLRPVTDRLVREDVDVIDVDEVDTTGEA
jgi:hypothetical protein